MDLPEFTKENADAALEALSNILDAMTPAKREKNKANFTFALGFLNAAKNAAPAELKEQATGS